MLHRVATASRLCAPHAIVMPFACAAASASSSVSSASLARAFTTSTVLQARPRRLPLKAGMARTIRYTAPPTFNALLRRFVMAVHPDTFGDAPAQQAVNQKSLQELNAFVSSMKDRADGATYPAPQRLKLVFYIKKRAGDKEYFAHSVRAGSHLIDNSARASLKAMNKKKMRVGERYVAKHLERVAASEGNTAEEEDASERAPQRGEVLSGEFHVLPVSIHATGLMCKHYIASQFRSAFLRAGLEGALAEFEWDPEYWKMGPNVAEPAAKA